MRVCLVSVCARYDMLHMGEPAKHVSQTAPHEHPSPPLHPHPHLLPLQVHLMKWGVLGHTPQHHHRKGRRWVWRCIGQGYSPPKLVIGRGLERRRVGGVGGRGV